MLDFYIQHLFLCLDWYYCFCYNCIKNGIALSTETSTYRLSGSSIGRVANLSGGIGRCRFIFCIPLSSARPLARSARCASRITGLAAAASVFASAGFFGLPLYLPSGIYCRLSWLALGQARHTMPKLGDGKGWTNIDRDDAVNRGIANAASVGTKISEHMRSMAE